MNTRTALLLGATGLVGGHCLDLLLADAAYDAVVTLGRRPLGRSHPKLTHHVVDFDRLAEAASLIEARDVFCCLGTTMKKAGSKEAFRKVDYEYPVAAARIAAANGAEQYLLISALGAGTRLSLSSTTGSKARSKKPSAHSRSTACTCCARR